MNMRVLTVILALGVGASACDRTEATARDAHTAAATATPAAVATSGAPAATPGGAAGAATREVTIPAGTHLPVVLDTSVGSDTSRIEEPVHAHMARAIVIRGQTVLPSGSRVSGVVTDATRSAKVKGRAHIAVRFDTLTPRDGDQHYRIRTTPVGRTAVGTKEKDALEIAGPAAGGALIGALVGGKKGALVGTAVGGGAGTAVVLSTRGKEIHLPKGAALTLRLSEPVTVSVRE
jgi:hypothetical protein